MCASLRVMTHDHRMIWASRPSDRALSTSTAPVLPALRSNSRKRGFVQDGGHSPRKCQGGATAGTAEDGRRAARRKGFLQLGQGSANVLRAGSLLRRLPGMLARRDQLWQSRLKTQSRCERACVRACPLPALYPSCVPVVTAWTPTPSHPPQGWNKVTNLRVAYSRWEKTSCLGVECLNGRQLDTFDTDIIVDLSAHQTILQICRGEGDVIIHRLQGDVSDTSPTFVLSDVPSLFDVFQELTFDLAQVNLKELARKGLGKRMGAVVWDRPAGLSTQIRPESI